MGLLDPFTQSSKRLIFDQTHSQIYPCAMQLKSDTAPAVGGVLPTSGHKGHMRKAIVRELLYGKHADYTSLHSNDEKIDFPYIVETKTAAIQTENNNNYINDLENEDGTYEDLTLSTEINSLKFDHLSFQPEKLHPANCCKFLRKEQHSERNNDLTWRRISTKVLKQNNVIINKKSLSDEEQVLRVPKGHSPLQIVLNEEENQPKLDEKVNKKRKYDDNKYFSKTTKKSKTKKSKMKCCPMKSQFVVEGFKQKIETVPPQSNQAWLWVGEPVIKAVFLNNDDPLVERICYPAIKHKKTGLVIRVKDCVLLRVDENEEDPSSVAKIASFWQDPENGEMMMSLLWYYRPDDIEHDKEPNHSPNEVYASRHADHTSVDCIEDKCYVLSLNKYCRYQRRARAFEEGVIEEPPKVPPLSDTNSSQHVPLNADPELILFCEKVVNFRTRRLMKCLKKILHVPREK